MLKKIGFAICLLVVVSSYGISLTTKNNPPVDLGKLIAGKRFTDGEHLVYTNRTGNKILLTFKSNELIQLIHVNPKGIRNVIDLKEAAQKSEVAPRALYTCLFTKDESTGKTGCVQTDYYQVLDREIFGKKISVAIYCHKTDC
jgi:hypothetical protein